jgi:glycerophosphoryl diester phosphodiesterase
MGERIPTIEEILAFARRHDVVIYLELKYEAAWGMHHALVGALRDPQDSARTVVISFDPSTLASLRRLDATIMTGLLVEERNADIVKAAIDVGARQLCPRSALVTRELMEEAHRSDLHVATWTVNDPEEMRTLMAAGVDGIMTDFPDRLRALIESSASA